MAPANNLCLYCSAIFLYIFTLFSSPSSATLPKVKVPFLVTKFYNGHSIGSRKFCCKALSTPEAATVRNSTQLGILIMKQGAANGKGTLDVYDKMAEKPGTTQVLKALNSCVEAYNYTILSFKILPSDLVEDPMTTNYDVSILAPKISKCEEELNEAKIQTPRLYLSNRVMQYHIAMGREITSILQREKSDDH